MAYTYQGDSILGVSLTVDTPKPLDSRSVVNNIHELYSIPEKTAYRGMTVANIDNGNLYMLVDKDKITEKAGWKASYESIQIITCSQEEYDEWKENTNEDFTPIDESLTYLHADTYYYIYEDDQGQYYLSSSWGQGIEEQLSKKASTDSVISLKGDLTTLASTLTNEYSKTETIIATYATLAMLDLEDENSFLSLTLSEYYKAAEVDEKFVTKESLRGDSSEEDDDFIFVTQTQYQKDQQAIQEELDKTLKLDGEGSLESITVNQIKSSIDEEGNQLTVEVKSDGLYVGGDKQIAVTDDIPQFVCLQTEEYDQLKEQGTLEPDTYYLTYSESDEDNGYVTKEYADTIFYSKTQVQELIAAVKTELQTTIDSLTERVSALEALLNNQEETT